MKYDIKELRTRLGLTQDAFARKLGVSVRCINRWEHGHHPSKLAQKLIDKLIKQSKS